MEQIATAISGVILQKKPVIATDGGAVLKLLQKDDALLPDFSEGFGELYFSEIAPGVIRAWKKHKRQEQLFSVPCGMVKLGFFDCREDSPTCGAAFALLLGRPAFWGVLRLPAGIWYGFAGVSDAPALICNLANLPHEPNEICRAPASGPDAPFDWHDLRLWQPENAD